MATNGSRSAAVAATRLAFRHGRLARTASSSPSLLQCTSRSFTTTTCRTQTESSEKLEEAERSEELLKKERPRWSYTPEAMKAPFSPHITKNPARSVWSVNSDPKKLDQMYVRLLGRDGDKLLPEEIKWLAVTHKSFDYGRRGFNDRLAFLGRQAVILEVTQGIMSSPPQQSAIAPDAHGREPFEHPALAKLDNFNVQHPSDVLSREKVERLALDVGLDKVLRWKPRLPENLAGSGIQVVLNGAVHAIVGAISLQHGAEVARKIVRERILARVALQ
ncbi:hypothetical protein ACRALDRAFT_2107447 [Sodiomyces alcalophilus JCM 7366]|uniref:mitochondrial 54S ribosomal protein mL57 n=1 Tax=Sodiomyces alcalophilus JCM 7366 TaxID=591952 RepID=UPI0039B6608C